MACRRNIVVFDFETGGRNPYECEIIQVAGCILNNKTFKTMSKFESLMKPEDFDALDPKALEVNGITKEQLEKAPEAKVVFPEFCEWIRKFNVTRDNGFWGAPVPCGYNINGFDIVLFDRYCQKFNFWDENQNRQTIMFPLNRLDIFDMMWLFLRTNSDVKSMKLVSLLEYCGITKEEIEAGAHKAEWDVDMTSRFAVKFLQLAKYLTTVSEHTGRRPMEIKNCLRTTGVANGG
jgi:DNA polymerase III alpha subunit (gram-positive type)